MTEVTDRECAHELKTLREELSALAERAAEQIALAMEALTAYAVTKSDEEIDRLNHSLHALLIAHVAADPAAVTRVPPLPSVSRYLERIGDHVKNLAEEVIFMVSAAEVRHLKPTHAN